MRLSTIRSTSESTTRAVSIADVLILHPFPADRDLFAGFADSQRTDSFAHTPLADHFTGHAGDALDVVGGPGGDIVKNKLFGHAAAKQNHQGIAQIGA